MPNHIDIWHNALDRDVCAEIVRRFEEDTEHHFQGVVQSEKGAKGVEHRQKKCTELAISYHENWADIDAIMFKAVSDGLERVICKYPSLEHMRANVADEGYRIKRYMPGGDEFFKVHSECNSFDQAHRQLVLFTYLNDVEVGGETEFPAHGIKVEPTAGTMVTFPPFWTHPHIGHPPVSGPKYAMQSWITFVRTDKRMIPFSSC